MGTGSKEHTLLDLIRSGDPQSALKVLLKQRPSHPRQTQPTELSTSRSNPSKSLLVFLPPRPTFYYSALSIPPPPTGLRSLSVDCHNSHAEPRLRFIDLSSFKFVYDTNEFRLGERNLLPAHLKPASNLPRNSHHPKTGTLRRKACPGKSLCGV